METIDFVALGLRLWLGAVMIMHGWNHARSIDGTARWFGSVGFSSARLNAQMSAYAELAIGLALVLGFLTQFATLGVVSIMFVAFWSIHRFAGFFVFNRPDEGYEYVVTVAVAAVALAAIGAGEISIDHLIGIATDLDGPVGAAIAGAGIAVGSAQVAVFWRKPQSKEEEE